MDNHSEFFFSEMFVAPSGKNLRTRLILTILVSNVVNVQYIHFFMYLKKSAYWDDNIVYRQYHGRL